ncbi:MAG: hypothetical protein KGI29_07595 [Pseudomonadota bacterium]|nr:hypothetical protein [Pseudomonadota bacterium]MDE3037481.1 hypothetical protein [Pseudomonadota bacterium]
MRSVFLIGLAVFLAVAGGGYCIGWFAQASRMKAGLEEAIASLNARQNVLTYRAIETSGFPGDVTVAIINPRFSGRVDLLLKSLPVAPGRPQPFTALPEWQEDDALNGRIAFSINALSNYYRIGVNGNVRHESRLAGQMIAADIHHNGESDCTLQLSRGSWSAGLWDYQAILHKGGDLLRDVRLLDCSSPGYAVTGAHQETLISSGPGRLYIASAPTQGMERLRVYLKMTDAGITTAGDAWLTAYAQAFGNRIPMQLSLYGEQNTEIDFSYAGPASMQQTGTEPIDIRIDPFRLANQSSTINAGFYFVDSGPASPRHVHVAFKAVSNFSGTYEAIEQNMLRRLIQDAYADKNRQHAGASPYLAALDKYTPGQMLAILTPAIPDLHTLGQLTQSLNASYEGAADFKTGVITLADFELSAAPYGVTGKGSAHLATGQPLPAGSLSLTCTNCLRLVDDAAGYAGRLQTTFSYFDPATAAGMTIDPRLVDGIKNFLGSIASPMRDAAGNATFVYAIASDGATGITVNDKNMAEVMRLYDEYVGGALRHEAAKAAAAPAPR